MVRLQVQCRIAEITPLERCRLRAHTLLLPLPNADTPNHLLEQQIAVTCPPPLVAQQEDTTAVS